MGTSKKKAGLAMAYMALVITLGTGTVFALNACAVKNTENPNAITRQNNTAEDAAKDNDEPQTSNYSKILTQFTGKDSVANVRIGGRITLEDGGIEARLDIGAILRNAGFPDARAQGDGSGHRDILTRDTLEAVLNVSGVVNYSIAAEIQYLATPINFNFLYSGALSMVLNSAVNSTLMDGFVNGNLKLTTGRHLTANDHHTVMVSEKLAEYNNIHVGDTIEIRFDLQYTTVTFEVIGIFSGTLGISGFYSSNGELIMDNATAVELVGNSYGPDELLPGPLTVGVDASFDIDSVFDTIANLPQVRGKGFDLRKW
jgi:hypothetical protein